MRHKTDEFWKIIKHNWTITERADLRAACEAWMSARADR